MPKTYIFILPKTYISKLPLTSFFYELEKNPLLRLVCEKSENVQAFLIKIAKKTKSSPDSCVKCYTMFLPFLLIKIDVFS
ncbi:hypothetical protein CYQ62_13910 [Enterococcus faecium]|nr:hypothetical protein CYQ62_13910 [Enterococcus faecium]